MIMDPKLHLRSAISIGICTGRLASIRPDGHGVVKGYTGPKTVLIPASVLLGTRLGGDVTYQVNLLPGGAAIAVRLLKTRSMPCGR
jgi:hypothetical protein